MRALLVVGVLAVELTPALSRAEAPAVLPVQGYLTNSAGLPVAGSPPLTFKLYPQSAGGSAFYTETQNVTVENGYFSVMLGRAGSPRLALSAFRDRGTVFLGITVGNEDEMSPRLELGSVPYAGFAQYTGEAATLQGLAPADILLRHDAIPWSSITDAPQGISDGDNDTLASLAPCRNNQVAKYVNETWHCADETGTLYQADTGLSLTGTRFSLDTSYTDTRYVQQDEVDAISTPMIEDGAVTGDKLGIVPCAAGQVLTKTLTGWACQSVNAGGVLPPHVMGDTGWLPFPHGTPVTIPLSATAPYLMMAWGRGWDNNGGELVFPMLSGNNYHYPPAYVEAGIGVNGFSVVLTGGSYLAQTNNLGDRNSVNLVSGSVRITAVDRVPDYTSDWQLCAANQNNILTHTLGRVPELMYAEAAQNVNGTGWRVPLMGSNTLNYNGNFAQANVVNISRNQVVLRTGTYLANFYDAAGTNLFPTTGFCRVSLFNWTPDYDSGWVPISTTAKQRDKWLRHGLGAFPSVLMAYVSDSADDPRVWMVPAMGNNLYGYAQGTMINHVNEEWVVIKGGQTYVARFQDGAGTDRYPTSGFVRVVAWH